MLISGWGRYPLEECVLQQPRSETDLLALLGQGSLIARGNGRGYGDCAQNAACTVDMRRFNRMLAFDPDTGCLAAEAGVLLSDVIASFLPRGWFPTVTPGTKYVTVGGMVAADVHGKNHHRDGSFGAFVDWLDVLGADGQVRRCSRDQNAELFAWTIGGMGLTGVILRAAFRLRRVESAWIRQTILPSPNLETAMRIFEDHAAASYSVAWIDCLAGGAALGRSIIALGEHATAAELPAPSRTHPYDVPAKKKLRIPFDMPAVLMNSWTVRAFNAAYYHREAGKRGERLVDWDSYFYPLDALVDWNRIYGRPGFLQFQCALPLAGAHRGLTALLRVIAESGQGSFLAVLKRLGAGQGGALSFPLEGYTLALDFPVSSRSLALMERLDEIVLARGGRFYLAKDSRLNARTLRASDDRVAQFVDMRRSLAATSFRSSQSERLQL
uniref:FAD-binding oxidoreductase n=1 Tax=Bosea sp. NBC_00436 TaxID=2969620 RepID=A0A9E7ZHC5_9HYPH